MKERPLQKFGGGHRSKALSCKLDSQEFAAGGAIRNNTLNKSLKQLQPETVLEWICVEASRALWDAKSCSSYLARPGIMSSRTSLQR